MAKGVEQQRGSKGNPLKAKHFTGGLDLEVNVQYEAFNLAQKGSAFRPRVAYYEEEGIVWKLKGVRPWRRSVTVALSSSEMSMSSKERRAKVKEENAKAKDLTAGWSARHPLEFSRRDIIDAAEAGADVLSLRKIKKVHFVNVDRLSALTTIRRTLSGKLSVATWLPQEVASYSTFMGRAIDEEGVKLRDRIAATLKDRKQKTSKK